MKRSIEAFGRWFGSAAGIVQTVAVLAVYVVVDLVHPAIDEHMFWGLVVMTIYSAATQPILAYIAYQAGAKSDAVLARLEALENDELAQLARLAAALTPGQAGAVTITPDGALEITNGHDQEREGA